MRPAATARISLALTFTVMFEAALTAIRLRLSARDEGGQAINTATVRNGRLRLRLRLKWLGLGTVLAIMVALIGLSLTLVITIIVTLVIPRERLRLRRGETRLLPEI